MKRKDKQTSLQLYSAPEVVEIEMSLENTILTSSADDWEEHED